MQEGTRGAPAGPGRRENERSTGVDRSQILISIHVKLYPFAHTCTHTHAHTHKFGRMENYRHSLRSQNYNPRARFYPNVLENYLKPRRDPMDVTRTRQLLRERFSVAHYTAAIHHVRKNTVVKCEHYFHALRQPCHPHEFMRTSVDNSGLVRRKV